MCAPSINKDPTKPAPELPKRPTTGPKDHQNLMWQQLQDAKQKADAEKKLLEDIAAQKGPPALSMAQWTAEQRKKKLTFSDTAGRMLS